ncbi:hypothetical protein A2U01_0070868, partial [Trifolium medium]|nr:hypothetical protein [Trifolium medium]
MSENTTEVIQLSDSEIDQIRESASRASLCDSVKMLSDKGERIREENEGGYHTGEKRTEAANRDVIVGREERVEVRIVNEFSEGCWRRRR